MLAGTTARRSPTRRHIRELCGVLSDPACCCDRRNGKDGISISAASLIGSLRLGIVCAGRWRSSVFAFP